MSVLTPFIVFHFRLLYQYLFQRYRLIQMSVSLHEDFHKNLFTFRVSLRYTIRSEGHRLGAGAVLVACCTEQSGDARLKITNFTSVN